MKYLLNLQLVRLNRKMYLTLNETKVLYSHASLNDRDTFLGMRR